MGIRAVLMIPGDMNLRTMVQASMMLRERARGFALCKQQSSETCSLHRVKIMQSRYANVNVGSRVSTFFP